ncbi:MULTISPECIES: DUF1822 family protein [unclassified Coleofasciculus]|uniref:DUF1822 family protein n=1 Tax=unclassified Coleofasciculus TaxID=2692782 RepID=UPI00187F1B4D|nr:MULTISPECIES: DUF1822 family protein [unclassified Coleofasciculus]MBE9128197.1 DUF1822 family protein [Coleofasciculus sp. LEGE 07081]MBE9150961.1 DUF1822 family protein [Coleofasciculus sp. LEGE 07092]
MNISNETAHLEIPLGLEAHRFAKQFASEQVTQQKRKKVYLNTLAVYAVHRYLQWLQIETDLSQSDSWHPVLRSRWDVADLMIPGIGKLECCPVLPGETSISLPPEAIEDRISCLGVQFGERLDQVQLLGFAEVIDGAVLPKQLLISELQPLDAFLSYLQRREEEFPPPKEDDLAPKEDDLVVNVALWLRNESDESAKRQGWTQPSPLIAASGWRLTQSFKQAIAQLKRDKGIEIPDDARYCCKAIHLDDTPLQLFALTWLLPPTGAESTSAEELYQIHQEWTLLLLLSTQSGSFLPKGIRLQVRDLTTVLKDEELPKEDLYLFARVSGDLNDQFIVTITLYGEELTLAPFICQLD